MLCGGNNSSIKADYLSDLDLNLEDINLSLSTHNTEARDDFTTHEYEDTLAFTKDVDCQLNRTQEQVEDHGETECTGNEETSYRKHFDGEQQEKQSKKTRRSREKKCREKRRKKDVSAFGLAKGMTSMAVQEETNDARNDPYRKSSSGKHSDTNTAEHAAALNIMMRAEEMVATRNRKEKADAKVKAKTTLQWQG